ncbi:hypothetical protein [uncultured Thomasclavelia sp.]|uniref:hypothetical protein n=1 Tax=uncultured Thomasclavelia sp. TaxID=3025759 RepID=UPI002598F308|nr:hypothetical protein [uncultured Thomasclavelia sp.]
MDLEELETTNIWKDYEKGRSFCRMHNMYAETDENYQMAFGNQWQGLKSGGIEPVQYNIIEPIVGYKVSQINQNLWALNFNSENFENREFRKTAEKVCKLLNKKASQVWEKDQLDYKVWTLSEDSAVNSEGIIYTDYDKEKQQPITQILNKNDIMYGNENNSDIQSQPYILIRQRMPLSQVIKMAENEGLPKEKLQYIRTDKDTFELTGVDSKYEVNDMCTVLTKMYKKAGHVYFSKAVKYVTIKENVNSGLTLYPLVHMIWREKKGSARGEGEVKYLISNQREINKTLMRYLLTIKKVSYPQKIVNEDYITNPAALDIIGSTIRVKGKEVQDVNKYVSITTPAQASYDVPKSIQDLISITRDLKNASEMATGNINPEQASGKAILAVQQASTQPLGRQSASLKTAIEDEGRVWLDMWIAYSDDGLTLEEEKTDPTTGEEYVELVKIPKRVLEKLQANVKLDVTPCAPFDRFAREVTLENLLKAGYFDYQNMSAFKRYVKALPDNSTAPKQDLLDIIEDMENEQKRIAQIDAQAQLMKQRAMQFLENDPDAQASQLQEAQTMVNNQQIQEPVENTEEQIEETPA